MKKLKSINAFQDNILDKSQMFTIFGGGVSYRDCVCSTSEGPCGDQRTTNLQDTNCDGNWCVVKEVTSFCI